MSKFSNWDLHYNVMQEVLESIGKSGKYTLKGGTSLMMYYDLDRISEDIDLDGLKDASLIKDRFFFDRLIELCNVNGYNYSISKDTDTVSRIMIHYNGENSADVLKVEASYRNSNYHSEGYTYEQKHDGVYVCTLDELMLSKCSTYYQRDKIRDLYDIAYTVVNFYYNLRADVQRTIYKTFEFETLTSFQVRFDSSEPDELVDLNRLLDLIVEMGEILNIEFDENQEYTNNVQIWIEDHIDYLDEDLDGFYYDMMDEFQVSYEVVQRWIDKYEEDNEW